MQFRPLTIKYRQGGKTVSIQADSSSGEIPAGSNTYYCLFYLNKVQVARVKRDQLLKHSKERYEELFGRPWLKAITEAPSISLTEFQDWENEIGGYPTDAEQIWSINGSKYNWVIQGEDWATLHVVNNEEVTEKGSFSDTLKKLFPDKKIKVYYPTVRVEEIT
jgi:hypothetical protein